MSSNNPRTIKTKTPPKLIIGLLIGGIALLGLIWFAVLQLSEQNFDARMRGTVVEKQFIKSPEEQVTFGQQGLTARQIEGQFLIFVDVPQRNGEMRRFQVDLKSRELFDSVSVGDSFDVGPYIQPSAVSSE